MPDVKIEELYKRPSIPPDARCDNCIFWKLWGVMHRHRALAPKGMGHCNQTLKVPMSKAGQIALTWTEDTEMFVVELPLRGLTGCDYVCDGWIEKSHDSSDETSP